VASTEEGGVKTHLHSPALLPPLQQLMLLTPDISQGRLAKLVIITFTLLNYLLSDDLKALHIY